MKKLELELKLAREDLKLYDVNSQQFQLKKLASAQGDEIRSLNEKIQALEQELNQSFQQTSSTTRLPQSVKPLKTTRSSSVISRQVRLNDV